MFKIDPSANRINPLEVKRFCDLDFTERKHLQEWLENCPQALAQGRERLGLLVINKDGNLAIIENKLGDSGRDVV